MPALKFHKLTLSTESTQTFMVWAQSEPSARKLWCETYLQCAPATQLEVIAHGKAGLAVVGLPEEETGESVSAEDHPWIDPIMAHLSKRSETKISAVLLDCGIDAYQQDAASHRKAGMLLRSFGWTQAVRDGMKIWVKPEQLETQP